MVSEKIRKVRKGVQSKKQAARNRLEKRRFRSELRRSKIRESGPVQEAKATKRELGKLAKELGAPASDVGEKIAAAGKRAQSAVESLDDEFGDPTRARSSDVRALKQKGIEQGVKAGDTAFKNRIKREVKEDRLEQLSQSEVDRIGMAGADFGIDLEVVDDIERGEEGGMGDLGFDTTFDAEPGVGLLGEGDPDDLEVIGEMDAIDDDLRRELDGDR